MVLKIGIVDDHPVVVEGLKFLLDNEAGFQVTQWAYDGKTLFEMLEKELPDVLLVDINLPDINGIDLCRQLKKKYNSLNILAISNHNEGSFILSMLQAGASGYLLKNANKDEILTAIKAVANSKKYLSQEIQSIITENVVNSFQSFQLTPREKEIIRLLAQGLTTIQIAEKLFISQLTVETHRRNILKKFDVSNTTSMIRMASELKLL